MLAAQKHFAFGRQLHLAVGDTDTDGAEADVGGRHGGGDATTFGLAVDFQHRHAKRQVPADQLR